MINYERAADGVRPAYQESHQRFWDRLASPGAWWTGAERVDIAREVRKARACGLCRARKAALSPHVVDGSHDAVTELPAAAVEVAHAVATDASRLTRRWYESVLDRGLSPGAYVEIVGTVAALMSVDGFCRGLGIAPHPLPEPRDGEPSGYSPSSAGPDEAWVPMVPVDNADTPERDLWIAGRAGNVVRALSLVPDEVRTLRDLSSAHYLPIEQVRDPQASQGALSRTQMELVAGRVSALHGCFY